jgi:hypothetical protein
MNHWQLQAASYRRGRTAAPAGTDTVLGPELDAKVTRLRRFVSRVKALDTERLKTAIVGVMQRHAGDAPARGPHECWMKPDKSKGFLLAHVHAPDADPKHLQAVREDLKAIKGVGSVSQGWTPPAPTDSWQKVYAMEPREDDLPSDTGADLGPPKHHRGGMITKGLGGPACSCKRPCAPGQACSQRCLNGRCGCGC